MRLYGRDRLYGWMGVVGVLAGLSGGCGGAAETAESVADPAPPTRMLSQGDVGKVVRQDLTTGPAISGVLTPSLIVDIKAKIAGDILKVSVQEGTVVRKGQSLAAMDTDELQYQLKSAEAELAAAEAALKNARQHLDRSKRLAGEGAIAPREIDTAQAEADAAQAQVTFRIARFHELRKIISDAGFPSPIDGVVSRRIAEPGDHADDGDVILTVVDPRIIELTASVSSEDIGRIRVGLPIVCRVEGYVDRTFKGSVARINPGADPVTRQVTVHAQIPNDTRDLIGGLFATGRIVTGQAEATLTVPVDALRSIDGNNAVFRIDAGVATSVSVTVTLRDEAAGLVAVAGALREGDIVLVGPTSDLAPGTRVALAVDSTKGR
ncbi:MAG: efflux RND transporter periplasmic adaptor subunit [candidate division Zixibacteria bacterium]|nr:efflux RND transporter periplasmic adaptor subunit [candidate division Zixibacteria bacterium]